MKPWYATNARQLLETRQRGLAPDRPVVVSLIGGQFAHLAATTLQVNSDMPAERLDWRMLVNLDVWVWADASTALARVMLLVERIARVRPKRLVLRFDSPFRFRRTDGEIESCDTHDVDIGDGIHHQAIAGAVAEQHGFYWCPVPMNGTPIERELRRALIATHELGSWL